MTPTPEELQKRIEDLERIITGLMRGDTLDRHIQTALETRLNFLNLIGVGSAAATASFGSFPVVVPANPSGTVRVNIGGVEYDLLYK